MKTFLAATTSLFFLIFSNTLDLLARATTVLDGHVGDDDDERLFFERNMLLLMMILLTTTTTIIVMIMTMMIMTPPNDKHTNYDSKSSFSSPDQPAATLGKS